MTTLVSNAYYLDDWDIVSKSYAKFIEEHEQEIDNLDEWVKKEPHLPKLSRPCLGFFLILTGNHSTEHAKEILDAYFTHKTRNPGIFMKRIINMKLVEQTLDLVEIAAPEPWEITLKGSRLTYIRLVDTDPSKLDFNLAMKVFTAAVDFELARVAHSIKGVVVALDMDGFHLGFLPKVNINDVAIVLKYIQILENALKEIHVINCNALISQVMILVRPLLSKNLMSKLHFFTPNEMDEFYKIVPKSFVPSTYGGSLPSMTDLNAEFRKRFQGSEDWFKLIDTEENRVKEDLRRVKAGCEEMNGSFRKLCID